MKNYLVERTYMAEEMHQRRAERMMAKRITNFHGTQGFMVADPIDGSLEWLPAAEFQAIPFDTPNEKGHYWKGKLEGAIKFLKERTKHMEGADRQRAYRCIKKIEGIVKDFDNFLINKSF